MTLFRYRAVGASGAVETGEAEGQTEAQAFDRLTALGLVVLELKPAGTVVATKPGRGTKKVPLADQAEVAEELAILFEARLSQPDAVRVLAEVSENAVVREHFRRTASLMADGVSFPVAFQRSSGAFSPVFVSLAAVADETRDLPRLFRALARYLRRRARAAQQISASLVYPAVLLIGAIILILIVSLFLAPNLAAMFDSLGRPVPPAVGVFAAIGGAVESWGVVLAAGLVSMLVGLALVARTPSVIRIRNNLLLRLPGIGDLMRTAALAQIALVLELMLTAGQPLAVALRNAARARPEGDRMGAPFAAAAASLESGGSAAETISAEPAIPRSFSELFRIGESTNTLAGVMGTLATALDDGLERRSQRLLRAAAPVITIVLGLLIGGLVYSVMSAILTINELAF